jgi:hypothetical protein
MREAAFYKAIRFDSRTYTHCKRSDLCYWPAVADPRPPPRPTSPDTLHTHVYFGRVKRLNEIDEGHFHVLADKVLEDLVDSLGAVEESDESFDISFHVRVDDEGISPCY